MTTSSGSDGEGDGRSGGDSGSDGGGIGGASDVERRRLAEADEGTAAWRRWGPYLSERQWGTVREDCSPDGEAWSHFTHDRARSRAYRWGEDGLAAVTAPLFHVVGPDDRGALREEPLP